MASEKLKTEADDSFRRGQYEEALRVYLDLLEGLAKKNDLQNETDSSEDNNSATELKQKTLSNMVACRLHLNQYEQALADATQCIDCDATWLKGYIRLAEVHVAMGNDLLASQVLGDILEKDPDHQVAMRMVDELLEKTYNQHTENAVEEKTDDFSKRRYFTAKYGLLVVTSAVFLIVLCGYEDTLMQAVITGRLLIWACIRFCLDNLEFAITVGVLLFQNRGTIGQGLAGVKPWLIICVLVVSFISIFWYSTGSPSYSIKGGTKLYYNLGVTPTATNAEIKANYRKLARALHPDQFRKEQAVATIRELKLLHVYETHFLNKERAEAYFREVGFAQSVLTNGTQRNVYDDCGELGLEALKGKLCDDDVKLCCSKVRQLVGQELARMQREYQQRRHEYNSYEHAYYRHEFDEF